MSPIVHAAVAVLAWAWANLSPEAKQQILDRILRLFEFDPEVPTNQSTISTRSGPMPATLVGCTIEPVPPSELDAEGPYEPQDRHPGHAGDPIGRPE